MPSMGYWAQIGSKAWPSGSLDSRGNTNQTITKSVVSHCNETYREEGISTKEVFTMVDQEGDT